MSKILFDEQPMVFDKSLARKLGLNEAIVVQQIHYWLKVNEKSNRNYIDGRYWTYNTLKDWHKNDFDFMSVDTVKRTFTKLENLGILIVGNYNKDRRDRTKWYSIDYIKLEELVSKNVNQSFSNSGNCKSANCTNAMDESEQQCKSANCTFAIYDESLKCNSAYCTNAIVHIAPTQEGNMHHTIPETTTEITNKEDQSIYQAKKENDRQMDLTDGTLEVETEDSLSFTSKEELLDNLKNKHDATEDQIIRAIKITKDLQDQGKVKNFWAYLSKVIKTVKTDDLTKSLAIAKGGDLAIDEAGLKKQKLIESLYMS